MPGPKRVPQPDVGPVDELDDVAPMTVAAALARVTAEIGGIAKKRPDNAGRDRGDRGITYAYRGIDAIAAAAQPLLGRYGVTITPTVTGWTVNEITKGGNPWTETCVEVDWIIRGPSWRPAGLLSAVDPGCADEVIAHTIGVGHDNADKGMNKSMTTAYKNLLLRVLCIGDPQDDTDAEANQHQLNEAGPAGPAEKATPKVAAIVSTLADAAGEPDNGPNDRAYKAMRWLLTAALGIPADGLPGIEDDDEKVARAGELAATIVRRVTEEAAKLDLPGEQAREQAARALARRVQTDKEPVEHVLTPAPAAGPDDAPGDALDDDAVRQRAETDAAIAAALVEAGTALESEFDGKDVPMAVVITRAADVLSDVLGMSVEDAKVLVVEYVANEAAAVVNG